MDTLSKILYLIKKNGISELEFTEKIGLYKTVVTEWKNKKTKSYNRHLPKIAKVLGVDVDYLLNEDEAEDETIRDETYIFVVGKNGVRKKYPVPREEVERFNKMVELILPGLLEDDENSDL